MTCGTAMRGRAWQAPIMSFRGIAQQELELGWTLSLEQLIEMRGNSAHCAGTRSLFMAAS